MFSLTALSARSRPPEQGPVAFAALRCKLRLLGGAQLHFHRGCIWKRAMGAHPAGYCPIGTVKVRGGLGGALYHGSPDPRVPASRCEVLSDW